MLKIVKHNLTHTKAISSIFENNEVSVSSMLNNFELCSVFTHQCSNYFKKEKNLKSKINTKTQMHNEKISSHADLYHLWEYDNGLWSTTKLS